MTFKRGIYVALILSLLGAALWFLRRHDVKQDASIASPTLKPGEQTKVILNPKRHTITTATRTGPVIQTFLPPHPVSVTIGTDGKVSVQSRAYGTEASPYIGFAYSDRARIAFGCDLFYWHRWETGPLLLVSPSGSLDVHVAVRLSFNVYSNTSLFMAVDNRGTPTGGISWKF